MHGMSSVIHSMSRAVHGMGGYKQKHISRNTWRVFRNAKMTSFEPAIRQILSPDLYQAAFTELNRRERELPEPSRPVAVHLDFRLGNLDDGGEDGAEVLALV